MLFKLCPHRFSDYDTGQRFNLWFCFFLLFINCYPLQLHVCKLAAVVCRCALVAAVYLVTLFVYTHPLLHTLTPPHVL